VSIDKKLAATLLTVNTTSSLPFDGTMPQVGCTFSHIGIADVFEEFPASLDPL
jgi:hypothetical protein